MKLQKLNPLTSGITQRAVHMSAICLISATLAACGGSSGGEMPGGSDTDNNGMDNGGIDNSGTDNGNNTINALGNFPVTELDSDGDGLFDTEEVALGLNPNSADSDGDGEDDGAEDADNDGISNLDEAYDNTLLDGIGETTPTDTTPVADRCADPDSSNYNWGDNCLLKQGGTWATSKYSQGLQRILWCTGFRAGPATTIEGFADGIFGPNTDQAVRDYQTARSITVDGKVGPQTWGKLQEELSIIDTLSGFTEDAHAIIGCDLTTVQFYNQTDGQSFLGWTMASTPGSLTQVPFSNEAP